MSIRENTPPLHYSDFMRQARPLDLVFFRGLPPRGGAASSELSLEKGEFSHVGMIINRSLLPDLKVDDDDLYLWESTLSSTTFLTPDHILNVESKKPVFGVQIRRLADVIQYNLHNKTINVWAPLIYNPTINYMLYSANDYEENKEEKEAQEIATLTYNNRLHKIKQQLMEIHEVYYHRPYEGNLFRMFGALFRFAKLPQSGYPKIKCLRSKCCIGKGWVFCSELVTVIYQAIGLVDSRINAALITPQDIINGNYSVYHKGKQIGKPQFPVLIQDLIKIELD